MRRLGFRLVHLEAVRTGQKTCTLRFDLRLKKVKDREVINLAFGRRDKPVLLQATITSNKAYYLKPYVKDMPASYRQALTMSQNNHYALFAEALERGKGEVIALSFKLKGKT